MKIGYVVGFLTPMGVSAGAVVSINGRESLVAKEAGTGRLIRLFKGEALKIDTCGSSNEFTNAVRTATGVTMYQPELNLNEETVISLSDLTETAPELAPETETVKVAKAPKIKSLKGLKQYFGTEAVADAIKQIRHKKAFRALPLEFKPLLKKLIGAY